MWGETTRRRLVVSSTWVTRLHSSLLSPDCGLEAPRNAFKYLPALGVGITRQKPSKGLL